MNSLAQKIPGLARHQGRKLPLKVRVSRVYAEIDKKVKREFPTTLDATTFAWGERHEPQLVADIRDALTQAEELAAQAMDKKIAEDKAWAAIERWRDLTVELFRRRHAAMQQGGGHV